MTLGFWGTPVEACLQGGCSKDKPHILKVDERCRVGDRPDNGGLLFLGCDAVSSGPGSLILGISGEALVVLGVHVATAPRGDKESMGIAIPINSVAEGANPTP